MEMAKAPSVHSPYATISTQLHMKLNHFLKNQLDKLGVFEFGYTLKPDSQCVMFEDGYYEGELDA